MIKIQEIRSRLSTIPDALYPIPSELANKGADSGIETVWDPEDSARKEAIDDYHVANDDEGETAEMGPEPDSLYEFAPDIEEVQVEGIMGGEEGEEIKRAVQVNGVDALAWYVPFHVTGAQWGIYLPTSGILYLIDRVFQKVDAPLGVKLQMAIRALHQHELFHFATDYLAGQFELLSGKPCHKPSRDLRVEELGYLPEEERLANAAMIRSFWGRRLRGKTAALREFVTFQGEGYREGGEITESTAFSSAISELVKKYASKVPTFSPDVLETPELDGAIFFPGIPADWRFCPIHLVNDHARLGLPSDLLDFLSRILSISESVQFNKSFQRAPGKIRRKWTALKERLAFSVAGTGVDFKLWKREAGGNVYSVRLSRTYRAHLRHHPSVGEWTAIDLGTHKQMGHG